MVSIFNYYLKLNEDPDFDGKLTSLVDIEELPLKAVVHILLEEDSSSVASTELLLHVSYPEHLSRWPPSPFQIPAFAFGVELRLREGKSEFEKNGRPLSSPIYAF